MENKKVQLKKYKWIATGLFLLMAIIFICTTIAQKYYTAHWIGYLRAFAEAAMVGALADWFAVTALFHHPMGLKIPHTNLIENSKAKIGNNLGNFVVENFLAPQNIRPYILKLKVAHLAGNWLHQEKNQQILLHESSVILLDILTKIEDTSATTFISEKMKEFGQSIKLNTLAGNGLEYFMNKGLHQQFISHLSSEIKMYIHNNQNMVRERVEKESYGFIPKFVDHSIADKITKGISQYFAEIEADKSHPLREEINQKLKKFANELKTEERWEKELENLKTNILSEDKIQNYATDIWENIKKSIYHELSAQDSTMKKYIRKNLQNLAEKLQKDEDLQYKIDHWIRVTAYQYILKNTHQFGSLISSTVGNWEGKELSQKLELEVGKDLQFIRINGTLVGGLVGLVIYSIVHILS